MFVYVYNMTDYIIERERKRDGRFLLVIRWEGMYIY